MSMKTWTHDSILVYDYDAAMLKKKILKKPEVNVFSTVIIFMIDHRCHGRVLEYSIAVAHPYLVQDVTTEESSFK